MNTMHYKGYTAKVWYSEEDGCFIGRVMGITDIVSFDRDSVKQLEEAFHSVIDHYVEASAAWRGAAKALFRVERLCGWIQRCMLALQWKRKRREKL